VLLRARLLAERARASAGARRPDPDAAVPDDAEATVEMVAVAASSGGRTVYGRPPLPTRAQLAAAFPQLLPALERRIHDALAGDPATAGPAPGPLELEGSRCNALGVELRRAGRAQQAATLHEAARLIYAEAGDSRGEALAANALGVALAELGDDDAALLQFEQARTLLHELGDRHWEGKVLANVGLAKQRAGRDEEAVDLLRDALAKLSPESEAYRLVEQRLLRAR
jgi:tetratricopeptide (TPR) repeat protein